jgi:Rubrerythrin
VTTFDLFRVAERIELAAAELYAMLGKRFASDEAAQRLFVRLSAEEHQHATRVRMLASRYRSEPKLVGNVAGARVLADCEFQIQAALAEVRAGAWGDDLAAVMERLAGLEAAISHAHAEALASEAHPALRDFLRQLSAQDASHQELLRGR